ncbi:hypothetical protein EVAR_69935_1 [Eumeta japonica]|uniref:Uncharacterized protein n=1 Tax=Eumeta variegata TaxID=151549 RepID=A0A4C2A3Y3_EUMVA|nr:hypothetical protein EVAR_69935_1 [Eumeta japonica]
MALLLNEVNERVISIIVGALVLIHGVLQKRVRFLGSPQCSCGLSEIKFHDTVNFIAPKKFLLRDFVSPARLTSPLGRRFDKIKNPIINLL